MAESTVKVTFIGDAKDLKRAMGDLDDSAERAHGSFGKLAAVAGGVFAGGAVVAGIKSVVGAASDLNETISKSQVLFGDSAGALQQWADGAAKNFGQSKQQALDAASTFAVFGKSAGLSGQSLVDFSTKFTGLASDMASFSNTSPQEAIEAIGAALRGEAEPIRKFGVLLDEATLKNEALKLGIISSTKDALTPQQKVLAAQAAIFAQTGAAQGDFARTSDGLANRTRILSAQFADMRTEIGQKLLPVAVKLAGFMLDDVVPAFQKLGGVFNWISDEIKTAAAIFGEFGVNVHAVGLVLGNFVGDLLTAFGVSGETAAKWSERVRETFYDIAEVAREVFGWLSDNIPPILEGIRASIETVLGWIETFWRNWGDEITRIVVTLFNYMREYIGAVLEVIQGIIQTVMAVIHGDWGEAWDGIKKIVDGVWESIKATIGAALNLISTLIDVAMTLIAGIFDKAWDGIKAATSKVIGEIVDFFEKAPGRVVLALGDLGGFIWNSLKSGFDTLKTKVTGGADDIVDAIKAVPGRIKDLGGDFLGAGSEIIGKFVDGLLSGIKGIAGGASDFAAGFADALRDVVNTQIIDRINRFFEFTISTGALGKLPGIPGEISFNPPDIPHLASGGIVKARAGGVLALLGEGGRDEAVVPLGRGAPGLGGNVTVNVFSPTVQNPVTANSLAYSIGKQAAVAFAGAA